MKQKIAKKLTELKNSLEYSIWRWWKNMTVGKALYILSPIWGTVLVFLVFLVPTIKGECGAYGDSMKYRIVGTTLHIEGTGAMDHYFYHEDVSEEPPWFAWKLFVTKVKISDGVTTIGSHAFEEFRALKTVEIPDSVWMIEEEAFRDCRRLQEVRAEGVRLVYPNAFSGCEALESVTLQHGKGTWGMMQEGAFRDCISLKDTALPDALYMGDYCFYNCKSLESLSVGELNWIGDYAFTNCDLLRSFDLGTLKAWKNKTDGTEYVRYGTGIFMNCYALESVRLHPLMTDIPRAMFNTCSSLKEVELYAGIQSIGENAFFRCTSLESVNLPDGLLTIGSDAFYECTAIAEITLPESVEEVFRSAFSYWQAGQTVYAPDESYLPGGLKNFHGDIVYLDDAA